MLPIEFGNVMLLISLMLVGYTFDYKVIDKTPIVKNLGSLYPPLPGPKVACLSQTAM